MVDQVRTDDGGGNGPIADVVADLLAAEHSEPSVSVAIHGTNNPVEIADQFVGVLAAVGRPVPVAECLFHVASVGSVTGVSLVDGARLVVKAYQPAWRADFLRWVIVAQERLWQAGLPCGKPVGGPVRCGRGFATVETYLADPGQPAVFGWEERAASAEGLAFVVANAGSDQHLAHHPLRPPEQGLYPAPHSPLFDFEATKEGAEWIDDLARLAKANKQDTPTVTAHTDWSARNVRLRSGGVVAVYDLDSLAAVNLPTAVGHAAVTWRAIGEAGEPAAPDIEEITDWFDRFPIRLSKAQRRAALAAALWSLCYTARCEHAIDPAEQLHHRARPRLRQDAVRFQQALAR